MSSPTMIRNASPKASPAKHVRRRFGHMIGGSLPMQELYEQIELAARTNIPVLLLGETGTGKDLAAQAIHRRSELAQKPYVPTNLGAYPSTLVASELFGHERGSFSGAHQQFAGVFERACDGTVFLDEIDCLEEKVRVSLLRVLESKEFYRLGGREVLRADFRLISASNADLPNLAENNEFRTDLFYRLDGLRINLPPLRDRRDDLPLLIDFLVARYNRSLRKKVEKVSSEVVDILRAYDWPGNIRELKNVVQQAMIQCDEKILKPEHLPPRFLDYRPRSNTVTFTIGTSLEEVERTMVARTLEAANDNRQKAASRLGISRRAIYSKLHKHNLM